MRRPITVSLVLLALVAAAALAAASRDPAGAAATKTNLSLVAYSTPKDAFGKIMGAFQDTPAGSGVSFDQSYGPSGDQARAVAAGQPADIVNLSLEPDVTSLVKAGIVPASWAKNSRRGILTRSVVVFVVRDGNPKHIRTWADLVKPGIEVITPNPFTSGGARWNVMAAYGAQRELGKTDKQAIAYLTKLFRHVPVQDKSAREALQTFARGKGDVLLSYENEAIFANKKGVRTDYVVPKQSILIESPVALTKSGLRHPEAKAFLRFLYGVKAQRIFADNGYRPVVKAAARGYSFPRPRGIFSITKVGGWKHVEKRFFDPRRGVMARIESSIRGSRG